MHATDLATGEPVRFDSAERPLDPIHVRASTSLLPDFDPVEVDGRLLCDGGFSENLPLRAVLGALPERPLLCVAADLMAAERPPRWSLDGMADRQQDLHFASQTRALIEAVTAELALAAARAAGPAPPVVLAHLVYRGREAAGRRRPTTTRRRPSPRAGPAGLADGRAMLARIWPRRRPRRRHRPHRPPAAAAGRRRRPAGHGPGGVTVGRRLPAEQHSSLFGTRLV